MKTKLLLLNLLVLTMGCKPTVELTENENVNRGMDKMEQNSNADNAHNSQNSLNYTGTYEGTIPCADCEGIKTTLTLLDNGTFTKITQYLGKEDRGNPEKGKYTWNDQGSEISTVNDANDTQRYKVGENVLFHLDKEGNRIEGDLAENYKLKKALKNFEYIENKKWVLVELLGKKIEEEVGKKQAYVMFNGELSRISGNNSCNTFNGSYELKGMGRISISGLAMTQMACIEMETAASFNDVISKVDNYSVKDGILNFNKAKMATLAKFKLE
jgi:uncharacterized lipoprotein NlpE involved in copper resistance